MSDLKALIEETEIRLSTGLNPDGSQVYIADDERRMRGLLDAAKADLPDRGAIVKALMLAAGVHGPISTVNDEGVVTTDMTPLVDAVDALLRGETKP